MEKKNELTKRQKELVDLFVSTKTHAKVRRRIQNSDGTFSFHVVMRDTSPIDFPVDEGEFALKIHEEKPDAPLSPIYINLRNLPDLLVHKIGEVLSEINIGKDVDFCTSIPKAATAYAKSYSEQTGIPYIEIFDKVEGEKTRSVIAKPDAKDGHGKKLIIIDDLIVHGNSKIEALREAEKLGYEIIALVVLIDRQQGGVKKVEEKGYKTYAAMSFLSILKYLHNSRQISNKRYDEVVQYLKR